ncbi:hypothetical protein EDM56_11930 [Brevibacillus fluminis]|uniref:Uncharacterized protein n=1 Tax=Brevibacillus fluminis TaxID=511487 RepID=A0A3M8DP06_9BACL|nr:hypothetical protein [Brevibacillus fluminis]RNB89860.1 hypothetical protein EDM56_11930 [Brevibacillus fluminis]
MLSKRKIGLLLGSMAVVVALGTGCAANPDQTAGGADTSAQHAQDGSGKGERGQRGGFSRILLQNNADLLSLLKVDETKLQDELKAGKTIADIAKEQGVAEDAVVSLLVSQEEAQLKKQVEDGKLTQDQADKMKENASDRVKSMIENKMDRGGMGRGGFGMMSFQNNTELLSLLKLDETKLQDALKAGKTIADIAKDQGVSEDDVIKLLVEQRKEQLKKEVTDGKMTQEQSDKMSEQLEISVKNMVEGKMGQRGGRGGGNPPSGDQPSASQPST